MVILKFKTFLHFFFVFFRVFLIFWIWNTRTRKDVEQNAGERRWKEAQEIVSRGEAGYVEARVDSVYVFSCYAPPSLNLQEFRQLIANIRADARMYKPYIIVGDFSAWAEEWAHERKRRGFSGNVCRFGHRPSKHKWHEHFSRQRRKLNNSIEKLLRPGSQFGC